MQHEVTYSRWGGQVRRANVRGQAFLSEALSNYRAMMVTEKILGPEQARRVYDFRIEREHEDNVAEVSGS